MVSSRSPFTSSGREVWRTIEVWVATASVALSAAFLFASNAGAADSMAVQPDGKLILVGGEPAYGPGVLIRLDGDGSLDPRFGEAGIVRESRATGPFRTVAVLPGGEIVVGGRSHFAPEGFPPHPLFGRFLPNGKIAANFGVRGLVETDGDGRATDVISGSDGSAIAGITEWTRAGIRGGGVESIDGSVIELGPGGALSAPLGAISGGSISDLLRLSDGSLAAAGATRQIPYSVQLAHFIAGSGPGYDPAFGEGQGLVSGEAGSIFGPESIVGGTAPDLVEDKGRLLVVGGEADEGPHPFGNVVEEGHPLLARFSDAGGLDTDFGEGGVLKPVVPGLPLSLASAAAVQPDGRIVVAFTTLPGDYGPPTEENEKHEVFLERFMPDGTLDPSFGGAGVVHVAPAGGSLTMIAEDLAALPNGRVVVSGATPDFKTMIAARFTEGGGLDPGFAKDGIVSVTPCPGKGCGPEVGRSSVKLKYLGHHRKPLLMLRLWVTGPPAGKIESVNLNLPRALSFRPRFASNAGAVPDFGESHFTIWPGAASVEGLRNRYVKLELGYGLLRVIRHRRLSHRPIHMEIGFASCPCGYESETETTQRLVLHLPRLRRR